MSVHVLHAFMKSNNLQQNATLEMSVLHVMLKKSVFTQKLNATN